jgi:ankyrin repeat protein
VGGSGSSFHSGGAVHAGSFNGHLEIVESSVTHGGAEIDLQNMKGSTPLALATSGGHLEIVQFLVEQGAGRQWKWKAR